MKKLEKSSILIGIGMFLVLFFAVSASGDAPPPLPDVGGKVCYSEGTPVVGATVTLNNTNKTDKETQTETRDNGEWWINMGRKIDARNGDEILITVTVPNSVEETKSKKIVVNRSGSGEQQVVEDFIFTKKTTSIPGLPSDGDGSPSDELPEEKSNATAAADEERVEENISEPLASPSLLPSPSPSEIKEKDKENESVAGKGEGETPLPTKEGDKGEDKSIPGFQFMYAVSAGLIAIAGFFIIRKLRLRGKGGVERR